MSFSLLRKNVLRNFFSVCLAMSLSGCVYLVVGSVGALGGYVVSPDTVEGVVAGYEQSQVWDAAVETISIMGVISESNDAAGVLICDLQGTKVTITTERMSDTAIKLTVKARKVFLPKIKVAQDVYVKIERYLSGS